MYKNFLAVLLGCFLTVIVLAVCDYTVEKITGARIRSSDFFADSKDIEGLGSGPRESKSLKKVGDLYVSNHKKNLGEEVLFDVNYSFNSDFRRVVPLTHEIETGRFIAFFGGSQTFGEGLNDNETIPAVVQKNTNAYRVYNFAYRGYGPNQMLRLIESGTLKDEIEESSGIAFYQYIDAHIPRALGTLGYIRWAGADTPNYEFNSEQKIVQNGTFATGRLPQSWFYWLLSKSAILLHFRVDLPVIQDQHYELVCGIVAKANDTFVKQFQNSRFIVIIGMGASQNSFIEPCLLSKKIEYIDLRGLTSNKKELTYKGDGHYTASGAYLIADRIGEEINILGGSDVYSQ